MTLSFDGLKGVQHRTWSSGDYASISRMTVPLALRLVEEVDPAPGADVLDVATGTGHVALAAARRFCRVTGLDYVPDLVEQARARAAAEGLQVDFEVGDAETLLRIGYLDEVVADGEALSARAAALAALLSERAPKAVQEMKAALNDIARGDADLAAVEAASLAPGSAELAEGRAAWLEKRAPRFMDP